MVGPSTKEQWVYWMYLTEEEKKRSSVKLELEKILLSEYVRLYENCVEIHSYKTQFIPLRFINLFAYFQTHKNTLSYDEVTTVRKNLQSSGVEVDNEFIRETWHPVYRRHFLRQALAKAYDCKRSFYAYHKGLESELGVRFRLR